MLYVFFWVICRRLNFICRRFGTLFHPHGRVGVEWLNLRIVGVANGRRFGSKIAWASSKEGEGAGSQRLTTHIEAAGWGGVCERDMARVRVGHRITSKNYRVIICCLLPLSLCRRSIQDLLKVRPLHYLLCNRTHPYSVTLLTTGSGYFRAKSSPLGYPNYSQI